MIWKGLFLRVPDLFYYKFKVFCVWTLRSCALRSFSSSLQHFLCRLHDVIIVGGILKRRKLFVRIKKCGFLNMVRILELWQTHFVFYYLLMCLLLFLYVSNKERAMNLKEFKADTCFVVTVQVEERAAGEAAAAGLSEAAHVELLELCEEQFSHLEKVHLHIPPTVCDFNQDRIKCNHTVCLCCSCRMKSSFLNLNFLRIFRNRWDAFSRCALFMLWIKCVVFKCLLKLQLCRVLLHVLDFSPVWSEWIACRWSSRTRIGYSFYIDCKSHVISLNVA